MRTKQRHFQFMASVGKKAKGKSAKRRGRRSRPGSGVSHDRRDLLAPGSAVHVTLRCTNKVPNLRSRRRFGCVARAFRKIGTDMAGSVRLIHFAVLGNHVHLVMEAESSATLAKAVQKMCLSMSRSLNAESVRRAHGDLDPRHGKWSERKGWIGRVFADRYHREVLGSPRQMQNAINYLFRNAENHYSQIEGIRCDVDMRTARLYLFQRDEKTADLFPEEPVKHQHAKQVWADTYTSLGYLFGRGHFALRDGGSWLLGRPKNYLLAKATMTLLRAM